MKVLITGATGFIGKALVDVLSNNDEVLTLGTKTSSCNSNEKQYSCRMENYSELPDIIPDRDIDVCIHLAWAGNSGKQKSDYFIQKNNADCTMDLIDSLHSMGIKRFIGIGTLAEKEVSKYHVMEGAIPPTSTTYGVCKLFTHMMSRIKCQSLGINFTWCTVANVYGPGDSTSNFVKTAIDVINSDKKAIFTEGIQLYDLIFIDDVVNALAAIIHSHSEHSEFYIGSGKVRQLRDYILDICSLVNPDKEIYFGALPYNNIFLDINDFNISALNDIGFAPSISFSEGLRRTLNSSRDTNCSINARLTRFQNGTSIFSISPPFPKCISIDTTNA